MINRNRIKELILYGIFGLVTTIVNLLCFRLFTDLVHMYYMWANVIAWCIAVLVAFVTNKIWVFQSHSWKLRTWMPEFAEFMGARLLTGIADMLLMYLAVSRMHCDKWISKLAVNILVIISNYLLSGLWVFRKNGNK